MNARQRGGLMVFILAAGFMVAEMARYGELTHLRILWLVVIAALMVLVPGADGDAQ